MKTVTFAALGLVGYAAAQQAPAYAAPPAYAPPPPYYGAPSSSPPCNTSSTSSTSSTAQTTTTPIYKYGTHGVITPSANLTTASATKPGTYPTSVTCAAPGTYDSHGRYSCSPAHQYPAGQTCEYVGGCPVLVYGTTSTTATPSPTPSCPAAGTTDSMGRYSCNPAHQYPAGQTCEYVGGCPVLVYGTTSTTCTTSTTAAPSATPSCPAAGTTDSMGRYSCNPAHEYPAGQTCEYVGGCPVLVYGTTSTTCTTSTTAAPSATPSCPAAGTMDYMGRYSCNPAHQYPAGQTCQYIGGCPVLVNVNATTSTTAAPSATPSCPAAGTTDNMGRYSCNPAHQYPVGQTCQYIGGCPYLVNVNATTSTTAAPSATPSCPAAGTTDNMGRYSCNPAHQYPVGQSCELVNGCYFLVGSDVYPTKPVTSMTTYCPTPTTITHQQKTYTVTEATTLTLPCYGGCNATKPVTSSPPQYTTPIVFKPWSNTTTVQMPPSYTTKVVTSLTTYCPQPTTFTHDQKTYTVTVATTLTLPCEGGCTVTKPVATAPVPTTSQPPVYTTTVETALTTYCPTPTTLTHQQSTYVVTKATTLTLPCEGGCTVTVSQPPVYTTTVETALTTYYPQPTTVTHEQSTYVVTKATTLTLPCTGGCTVTKPVATAPVPTTPVDTAPVPTAPAPSATPSCPAPGSTDMNGRYSCNPAHSYPVGQICTLVDGCYYLVSPPSSSQPPVSPTTYAAPPPTSSVVVPVYPSPPAGTGMVSQPSGYLPGPSSTAPLTPYTGAAASIKAAVPFVAAMVMGALFL